jgi:hypothetical protein
LSGFHNIKWFTALIVGLAVSVMMAQSGYGASSYTKAQLNLLLNGSTIYAKGMQCFDLETAMASSPGEPVLTVTFEPGGTLIIHSVCASSRSTISSDSVGSWRMSDNQVCVRSTDSIFVQTLPENGENCMTAEEARFGFELVDNQQQRVWYFRVENHPVFGSKEDLLQALAEVSQDQVADKPPVTQSPLVQPAPKAVVTPPSDTSIVPLARPAPIPRPEPAPQAIPASEPPLAQKPKTISNSARDAAMWTSIRGSTDIADYLNYLEVYPNGMFVTLADTQIRNLVSGQAGSVNASSEDHDATYGRYFALVIGNNKYQYLPDLRTAVNDAKALADLLDQTYSFTVTLLLDATRSDILDALDKMAETLGEADNLLIYYAGHGLLDEGAGRGYWLATDAKPNRRNNWVSNSTLTDTLSILEAKHVMVIADSCFSGTLVRASKAGVRAGDYWKRMARKRTRVALVSGGLEPVSDGTGSHSPFAEALLSALRSNRAIMDGTQLFDHLRRPVMISASQTPQYADVRQAGHDGGDFLFVRKR